MVMIPDFKTYIGESVWSDIHKRSNGETVRKEDDVNLMNSDDFMAYLEDMYKVNVNYCMIYIDRKDVINVPLLSKRDNAVDYIYYSKDNGRVYVWDRFTKNSNLLDILKRKYRFTIYQDQYSNFVRFYPEDKKVNNSFFIEVIDFILNTVNSDPDYTVYYSHLYKVVLSKRTNESIWSDIHKRSNGNQMRKEDISLLNDDLTEIDLDKAGTLTDVDIFQNGTANYYFSTDQPLATNEEAMDVFWSMVETTDEDIKWEFDGTQAFATNPDGMEIQLDASGNGDFTHHLVHVTVLNLGK